MPVTTNIVASYRGPRKVFADLLSNGPREDRALAYVMGFAVVSFISRLPELARQAHFTGEDLNMLMGASLMASIFMLPLFLYLFSVLTYAILRLFRWGGTGYGLRIALFWSLLAVSPLVLLDGLVAGFIGQGPALTSVRVVGGVVMLWFFISGLREAGSKGKNV